MEKGEKDKDGIEQDSLYDKVIRAERMKFVLQFPTPVMHQDAGRIFDDYMKAGGNLNPEDLRALATIVETGSRREGQPAADRPGEQSHIRQGQLMVRNRIAIVKKHLEPLPKRGDAFAGRQKRTRRETEEEEYQLKAFSMSLKPPKLPAGMGPAAKPSTAEVPERSGIKLIGSDSWLPDGDEEDDKKQA
jgi:hypothetical protein